MTNEIIFKTRVDTGTTSKDLAAISTELGKIDESAKTVGTDSAAQLEALNKRIAAGGMTARQLSKSIRDYMTIAIEAGRTSPVGQQAIAQAAALQDELGDLRNEITNAAHDGANMQAALQLGGTLVAGYGVAQGAMAMMGVENEKLMQTMVKLQAATSVLTGLEQIRANLEHQTFLMQKAKILQTKMLTAVTAVYSTVVGASTGALKLFRIALISTGIGAIIVAVGLLIANFDKLQGYVMKGYAAFDKLGTGIKIALGLIFPYIGAIYLAIKALKHFGIISDEVVEVETNAAKARRKLIQEQTEAHRKMVDEALVDNKRLQSSIEKHYDFEIAKAKAAGKDVFDLEKEKRAEMRKTLEAQILLLEESLKLNANNATAMMQIIKDMAAVRSAITESEQQDELAGIQRSTDARKKAAENRKALDKKQEEETAKALERERLLRDYFIASIADDDVRASLEMQERHKRELEDLKSKYVADAEMENALRKQQNLERAKLENEWIDAQTQIKTDAQIKEAEATRRNEMAALELKLIAIEKEGQDTYAVRQQILEAERLQALENTELTENEKLLIEAKYDKQRDDLRNENLEKEEDIQAKIKQGLIDTYQQSFTAVQALSDAIFANRLANADKGSAKELAIQKKQFEIGKKIQIAQALMQGYQAVLAAYASGSAVPVIGAILGPAQAALAGIVAASNVAKIRATKFEGGSFSPPTTPQAPQVGAPEIPQTPNAQTTQTAGLVNQSNKVVVVDSEIKAVMDNSQQIQVVSSFG
jgi:hypothetical protein